MKALFKFILYTLGICCISILSIYIVWYIDKNNLTESILSDVSIKTSGFLSHTLEEAQLDFARPHDSRPIVVELSKKNSKDKEYQYIYPAQIFYADKHSIELLFRDSVFSVDNHITIEKLGKRLTNSIHGAFYITKSLIINKAAIIGVFRTRRKPFYNGSKDAYHYTYGVKLINHKQLDITEKLYKEITKKIDLADSDFSF